MVVNTIPLHGTQDQEENVEFKNRSERERKRERGLSSDNISVLINNYNWSARDIHKNRIVLYRDILEQIICKVFIDCTYEIVDHSVCLI